MGAPEALAAGGPQGKEPPGFRWREVLSGGTVNDVASAIQDIRAAVEVIASTATPDNQGLVPAIISALHSRQPQRILLGTVAALSAFELAPRLWAASQTSTDTVIGGLGAAAAGQSPLIAASAIRALCAAATSSVEPGAESSTQARLRKVLNLVRAASDAHPRSSMVHEAVVEGYCAVLCSTHLHLQGHAAALWDALWPTAVHPRQEVADIGGLCLCKLTAFKKGAHGTRPGSGSTEQAHMNFPAEEAMGKVCTELQQLFRMVDLSSVQASSSKGASQLAALQAARLLQLLRRLLLSSEGACQRVGHREQVDSQDGRAILVPVAVILGTIGTVFGAALRDTSVAVGALDGAGPGAIFAATLDLAATLLHVAGATVVPHAVQLRRWVELLVDHAPLPSSGRHTPAICRLLSAMAHWVPSVLLNALLLPRVVRYLLAAAEALEAVPLGRPSEAVAAGTKRGKRRHAEAFGRGAAAEGRRGAAESARVRDALDAVRVAWSTLAEMFVVGAPLLKPPDVAEVCERLVRVLWLGLVAPTSNRVGFQDTAPSATEARPGACLYHRVCRDVPCLMAVLDIVEALYQPSRPGGPAPLAAGLTSAFAGLLELLTMTHTRPSLDGRLRRTAIEGSVRARAQHVRGLVVAATAATGGRDAGKPSDAAALSIEWPAPSEPPRSEPAVPAASEDVVMSPAAGPDPVQVAAQEDAGAGASATQSEAGPALPTAPEAAAADAEAAAEAAGATDAPARDVEAVSGEAAGATVAPTGDVAGAQAAEAVGVPEARGTSPAQGPASPGEAAEARAGPAAVRGGDSGSAATAAGHVVEATAATVSATVETVNPSTTVIEGVAPAGPLELFPDIGEEGSPVPELCLDSPSEEGA